MHVAIEVNEALRALDKSGPEKAPMYLLRNPRGVPIHDPALGSFRHCESLHPPCRSFELSGQLRLCRRHYGDRR